MPEIYPFKAYRYSNSKSLNRVICPPYDVISPAQAASYRKCAENAIRVELPEGDERQKYENARKIWEDWKSRGVVAQDSEPSFYVYEQVFKVKGKKYSRRGFFCELTVEEPGKGTVLRHELTLAGPKADRLNLIRTARINTSPIFGLLADPKKSIRKMISKAIRQKPLEAVKDSDGVTHRLWSCSSPADIAAVQKAAQANPVLIADGHHRYETSWNYFLERRGAEGDNGPASHTLFFICPLEDPGLVVFPTHRVLKHKTLDEIFEKVLARKDIFEIRPEKNPTVPHAPFFTATDGKKAFSVRLRARDKAPVLEHLHARLLPELQKEDFTYTHDAKEALALARKTGMAAILVPPVPVQEMNAIVRAGKLMPQKSTYFYPKVITGLLFRSLE